MDPRPVLILPLLLVLFLSGCATQTTTGNGVVIEEFRTDFAQVFSGEPTNFYVKIRNTGSSNAGDIDVIMANLNEWGEPGSCSFSGLLAPNPLYGTEGEEGTCTFSYEAPEVAQSVPYRATARLTYKYKSTAVKTVTVASRDELKRLQDLGAALPSETKEQSDAPVQIDIEVQGPVRFWENRDVEFPVKITVTNAGGGVVCSDRCDQSGNWHKITIKTSEGAIGTSCGDMEITLYQGQSNSVTCTATADADDIIGSVQESIQVGSEFYYMLDNEITVTVSPGY